MLRPDLARWAHLAEPPAPPSPGRPRVSFLGVSTLLFDDGETALLTDGFFSRPSALRVLTGRIAPDRSRVAAALARAGIRRLAAVLPVHSHYDHALDAPLVADLTGALLLGSESTRNIGRGQGLPDDRIRVVTPGEALTFGRFTVTAVAAAHTPGDAAPGSIDRPLRPPARARAFRTGQCWSVHIRHDGGSALVHASTNSIAGALDGRPSDVAYLGIATLGRRGEEFRERYWRETVVATGARRVVVVHWDDFTRPLDRPLRPLPPLFDDFDASMTWLERRAAVDNVRLGLPLLWQPTDPWRTDAAAEGSGGV